MCSINFCKDLEVRWNSLDAVDKRTVKLAGLSIITAIAFTAIALILLLTAKESTIGDWTVSSFVKVSLLPAGAIVTAALLLAAILNRTCTRHFQKLEQKQKEKIEKDLKDPNSSLRKGLHNWRSGMQESVSLAYAECRKKMEAEGSDLISLLNQLEAGTLVAVSDEEKEIFQMMLQGAFALKALTSEEATLCRKHGIDPDRVRVY